MPASATASGDCDRTIGLAAGKSMNSGDGSTNCSAEAFLRTDWLEGELAEAGLTDGAELERVRLVVFDGSWK